MNRPGSALWLLRHELRNGLADNFAPRADTGKRGIDKKSAAVWIAMIAGLHGAALFVLWEMPDFGRGVAAPSQLAGLTASILAGFLFMMASGMKASVEALYERGDLDLLLSSPVSSTSIFVVRLAGVFARIAGLYLFFLAPFANAGLVLGRPRLMAIYIVIAALSALAASLSMLLTLTLVRLFGVRKARLLAQALGPLFGALLFIASQLVSTAARDDMQRAAAVLTPMLGAESSWSLPARAALGEAAALLALTLAAAAALWTTAMLTHRFFVQGLQQAAGAARVAARPADGARYRFGRGLAHAVLVKEWLLIARDPQLISQVLLQLLYLVPLCAALFAETGASLASVGTALTFLCSSITGALTWIVMAAEDAPDLLAASPADAATIRRAKLLAALVPVLGLVALPLAWVGLRHPLAGLVMSGTVFAASLSAAMIVTWFARPAPRSGFIARARGNHLASVFDLLTTAGWAGTAYVLIHGTTLPGWPAHLLIGAAGTTLCALLALAAARVWRLRGAKRPSPAK